jgi:hypothetical protein
MGILDIEFNLFAWSTRTLATPQVKFDIKDAHTGEHVGEIINKFRAANLFSASDADNYEVHFGKVTDPRWKAMLVVLAIFIDMRYFEQSGSKQRDNSALGRMK